MSKNLKRFVIAGHADGQADAMAKLRRCVEERKPDGVLFGGGILGNGSGHPADKLKRWEEFFSGLGKLDVFTAVVPGASEAPLREFLRLAKAAEVAYPKLHVAHVTLFEDRNMALAGLGGELTENEDRTEDRLSYARASAEYYLRGIQRTEQTYKVLLLSVAPLGQLGGDDGNRVCDDFIKSFHPSLCVASGATGRRGFMWIGHTLVINPGRLADGSLAWLDWNRSRGDQVELLTM